MESSRIFVKGLPPTFSDAEFRKHFSQKSAITDAKIFPNRRIGYVGYKTPDDARKAVKFFNKTFIRMSRINVEIARPIADSKPTPSASSQITTRSNAASTELKRKREEGEQEDPKLQEFLEVMKPKSKKRVWETEVEQTAVNTAGVVADDASDDEYETVPKKQKKEDRNSEETVQPGPMTTEENAAVDGEDAQPTPANYSSMTDADWARSRTSRLLGLLDEDEEEFAAMKEDDKDTPEPTAQPVSAADPAPEHSIPTPPSDDHADPPSAVEDHAVRSSMRLFVRNLPYDTTREALEAEFLHYNNLDEVHLPLDVKTGSCKGFALVQFSDPDSAERAMSEKDGTVFQGRILHVLPAQAKRDTKLDDFTLSKLPLKKQQQIKKRREATSTEFNWNALYMNADAVISSVADRLGIAKSEVLDPTSSDAAVKQAHAETHLIQETKSYFQKHGVDLDAFKYSKRGDTAVLVKNIPYDCSKDQLQRLFEEHGEVKRFLMPPSGIIAIVEMANSAQCKTAFGALAYKRIKSAPLFLEKAPKDIFSGAASNVDDEPQHGITKASANELKDAETPVSDSAGRATLYVRNLNFSTSTPDLIATFNVLDGFLSARVKTKTDPKKPGQILSMGFGFLEFSTSQQAEVAMRAMNGYNLHGHKLEIRASHKGADAAEDRRKADAAKKTANQKTKIIVKNLPFEATKKDVRELLRAHGELRSVRVPKKMDRAARGFAFAEFVTAKDAANAIAALKDTHLLGRHLVLDYADGDAEDAEAEIEKMQQKIGAQVNKVALQKLTSGGRKKFTTASNEDDP